MEENKYIKPELGLYFDQAILSKGKQTKGLGLTLYASRLNTFDKAQLVGEMINQGYIKDWNWLNICNNSEQIISLFVEILKVDNYKKQEKELLIKKFIEELITSVVEHHESDIQDIIDVREPIASKRYESFRGGDPLFDRGGEWVNDPISGQSVWIR